MEKTFHATISQKKIWDIYIYIRQTDFKTKIVIRDKEVHYLVIKRSVQQKDKTFLNIYAPSIGAPKYIMQY